MLLSHHPPSQYCRTYMIFGIRFCARCSGIIIGMSICYLFTFNIKWWFFLILPIPTFINFLIQELNWIKSINLLKTFLTIFLGFYLFELLESLIQLDLLKFTAMVSYILLIEFIIAFILKRNMKLDILIEEYLEGIHIK